MKRINSNKGFTMVELLATVATVLDEKFGKYLKFVSLKNVIV